MVTHKRGSKHNFGDPHCNNNSCFGDSKVSAPTHKLVLTHRLRNTVLNIQTNIRPYKPKLLVVGTSMVFLRKVSSRGGRQSVGQNVDLFVKMWTYFTPGRFFEAGLFPSKGLSRDCREVEWMVVKVMGLVRATYRVYQWCLDWALVQEMRWLFTGHFWPLLMWATHFRTARSLPEIKPPQPESKLKSLTHSVVWKIKTNKLFPKLWSKMSILLLGSGLIQNLEFEVWTLSKFHKNF